MDPLFVKCEDEVISIKQELQDPLSLECESGVDTCGDELVDVNCALPELKVEINSEFVKCEYNVPENEDGKDELEPSCDSERQLHPKSDKTCRSRHQMAQSGQRPYMCDVCNKSFTQKRNLKTHQLVHSGELPYMCDVCNKKFADKGSLNRHKKIHSGQRPYMCDICNKTFTHKSNLKTHKLFHSDQRPYMCDVCNKTFAYKSNFNEHKLLHTGQRPYMCDVCNKTFTQSSHLKTHQVVHSGHHPYICDICNKTFTQSSHLKTHQVVHNGQHPYMCDVCKKKFAYKSSLNAHRLLHSGQHSYMCDVCDKTFTHKGYLHKHQASRCAAEHMEQNIQKGDEANISRPVGTTKINNNEDQTTQRCHEEAVTSVPVKTRKTNKRKENKVLRNLGKAYVSNEKTVNERELGPDCNCNKNCFLRVNEEERKIIMTEFWAMGDYNIQNAYLYGRLHAKAIKRKYTKSVLSRRKNTIEYTVLVEGQDITICKVAFLSIHGLQKSRGRIEILTKRLGEGQNTPPLDRRGSHDSRVNVYSYEQHELVIEQKQNTQI